MLRDPRVSEKKGWDGAVSGVEAGVFVVCFPFPSLVFHPGSVRALRDQARCVEVSKPTCHRDGGSAQRQYVRVSVSTFLLYVQDCAAVHGACNRGSDLDHPFFRPTDARCSSHLSPDVPCLLAHMMPVRFGCGLSLGMSIWLRVSDICRVFDPMDIDM
jgi:hypothetical protein